MSEYPTHLIRRIRHKAFGAEERIVLFVLADRMKNTTDVVWPSVETIASDCGMSERAVRYVIGWLVSIGALVEFDDGRRTRTFRIDFELLERVPEHMPPRSRPKIDRHPVHPSRHDVHPDRHPVQDDQTGTRCTQGCTVEQGDRHPVHLRPAPGAPKGFREGTKKEPEKEPNSARVPRRANGSSGANLGWDFGQADSSNPTTNPAPPPTRPEAFAPVPDALPVEDPDPPSKDKWKAVKNAAVKLTEDQARAHTATIEFWSDTYLKEKGERPIINGRDIKTIDDILKMVGWDSDKACRLISNAFTYPWFREKLATVGEIKTNPSRYQVPNVSEKKRVSSAQVEPDASFWENRNSNEMEDLYS